MESIEKNLHSKLSSVPSVKVLDIPMFDGTIEDATDILIETIDKGEKHNYCISATGAHGLVTTKSDKQFKTTLENFYINLPDGMPGVWVGRLKGAKKIDRCYGPDFFGYFMLNTANKNINHYFCGGKEGVADKLKQACKDKFNNENVVGTYCPPFRELTDEEMLTLAEDIKNKKADMVWIGISTPKQEKFASRLSKYTETHFLISVGAAFDFHIGNVRQAPKYMQRNGLEWLFRLSVEPKRLWKRYIDIVPKFIYYNIVNILNLKKK